MRHLGHAAEQRLAHLGDDGAGAETMELSTPQVCFTLLFVAYPGVALKVMQTFHCQNVEGTSFLIADMRLQCYTPEWFGYGR